jgi:hypothetical protein
MIVLRIDRNVEDYFEAKTVDGILKAVCKVCGRAVVRNVGTMGMHYRMAHGQGLAKSQFDGVKRTPVRSAPYDNNSIDGDDSDDVATSISPADQQQYVKQPPRRPSAASVGKHTIKYLETCTDPHAYTAMARAAPDDTIRAICNAALNVERGDIHLAPDQKVLFHTHRGEIATLTSPRVSLARKRKVIQNQKGGFFFIPALIGAALGTVGSKLIGSLIGGQQ